MRPYSLAFAVVSLALAGCGDDDYGNHSNCGAGTILVDGQCVVDRDSSSHPDSNTSQDAKVQRDSSSQSDTGARLDSSSSDSSVDVLPPNCPQDDSDRGFVGAPCSADCQCKQDVKGQPLFCYDGPYMEGFRFCTDYARNRSGLATLSEYDHVDTIKLTPSCFPHDSEAARGDIYVLQCSSVADCKAVGAAYDRCGSGGLMGTASGQRGVICPTATSTATMSLVSSCLISTTSPFNGDALVR